MPKTSKSENIIFIIGFVFFIVICVPLIIRDIFFEDHVSQQTTTEQHAEEIYDYEDGYDKGNADGYEDGYDDGYYSGFEEAISVLSDEVCYRLDDLVSQINKITPDTEEESSALLEIEELISDIYDECG